MPANHISTRWTKEEGKKIEEKVNVQGQEMWPKCYTGVERGPTIVKDTKSVRSCIKNLKIRSNAKMRRIRENLKKMKKLLFPGFGLEKGCATGFGP